MRFKERKEVLDKIQSYPLPAKKALLNLRGLIVQIAHETEGVEVLEETFKWGEPTYVSNIGTNLRIDWKERSPHRIGLYVQCTSKLIPSIQLAYPKSFDFEGARAIHFNIEDELPTTELKPCIQAGLRYQKVKQLPNLGL